MKHIMNPKPLVLQYDEVFDDAKRTLLSSDLRGLPVLKEGEFAGVVTRRSFIEKPRRKIIMIDHNETAQSIPGAHDADVREIIDHHRLAADKTNAPIYVFSKPLGSSCTLTYLHYRMHGITIEKPYAVLMLSGLLSDTLVLKSPTTTEEDRAAARDLASIAGLNIVEYGKEIQSKMTTLENLDPPRFRSLLGNRSSRDHQPRRHRGTNAPLPLGFGAGTKGKPARLEHAPRHRRHHRGQRAPDDAVRASRKPFGVPEDLGEPLSLAGCRVAQEATAPRNPPGHGTGSQLSLQRKCFWKNDLARPQAS